ncbi:MAG TPA: arylsulfotransferase family protein [Solirubrobacteraceae bacterium]|nr:arylsulfotransferase family protein [Solirubrobacteraceae bacterium]
MPRQIASVRVVGSVSGPHPGRLAPYSRGGGASFILRHPLTEGEHASVVVRIAGRGPIHFGFTVARLAPTQPPLNIPVLQPAKLDHFVSQPELLAPQITVHRGAGVPSGYIFLAPLPSPEIHPESNNVLTIHPVGPGGPMIVDNRGRLVWFHQLQPPFVAANFRPQRFDGHEVLTWWQGGVTPAAFGLGEGVIADTSYRTLRIVRTGNGYSADIHEFVITPDGDALFTAYSPILVHLPGTPSVTLSPLLDSIVQEVDIRTGLVMWEWHAYGHIPLADSYATAATSSTFDAYHLNSIQLLAGDRVLVSARDTSAVYDIDAGTGRILWTLGGKASSFRLGRGVRFFFQHDAQLRPDGTVTLFDDEAGPPIEAKSSRAIVVALDQRHKTARLVRQYRRTADTLADSEGNMQTLPSGNPFVGFGSAPAFSEFSAGGRLLFDASLPVDDGSYREYLFPWTATPRTRPALAARRTAAGRVSVYASWNGATTVARWQVLGGASAASLTPLATAAASGFETRVTVSSSASTFAVRALSARGRVLASSAAVSPS